MSIYASRVEGVSRVEGRGWRVRGDTAELCRARVVGGGAVGGERGGRSVVCVSAWAAGGESSRWRRAACGANV